MNLPDIYYIRVVFELDNTMQENQECIDKFIESYNSIIKNKCNLNEKCFTKNDIDICGTGENLNYKYVSNPYELNYKHPLDPSYYDNIRIQLRFYNGMNEKWTFEELNTFIKTFVKISSEYINTDYMRTFIELELENF
jgi:hypothetical protein